MQRAGVPRRAECAGAVCVHAVCAALYSRGVARGVRPDVILCFFVYAALFRNNMFQSRRESFRKRQASGKGPRRRLWRRPTNGVAVRGGRGCRYAYFPAASRAARRVPRWHWSCQGLVGAPNHPWASQPPKTAFSEQREPRLRLQFHSSAPPPTRIPSAADAAGAEVSRQSAAGSAAQPRQLQRQRDRFRRGVAGGSQQERSEHDRRGGNWDRVHHRLHIRRSQWRRRGCKGATPHEQTSRRVDGVGRLRLYGKVAFLCAPRRWA
eukprot:3508398-Prymnesium_polylepis.3